MERGTSRPYPSKEGGRTFSGRGLLIATVSPPRCSGSCVGGGGAWGPLHCRAWTCPSACVYEDVPTCGVCVCTSGVSAPGVLSIGPCFPRPPSGLGSPGAQGDDCLAADSWVGAIRGGAGQGLAAGVSSRAGVRECFLPQPVLLDPDARPRPLHQGWGTECDRLGSCTVSSPFLGLPSLQALKSYILILII